jgi:hypothetical protein
MDNLVAASKVLRSGILDAVLTRRSTLFGQLRVEPAPIPLFDFSGLRALNVSLFAALYINHTRLSFRVDPDLIKPLNIDLHHHQCDVTSLATYKMHWLLRLCFGVLLLVFPGVPLRGCVVKSYLTGYPLWNPTLRRRACHRHLSPVF